MGKKWSDDELREAVKTSETFIEVYRKLKLKGNFHRSVLNRMQKLQIYDSHFSIKRKRTGPQIKISLEEIFSGKRRYGSAYLKERLLRSNLFEYKCSICSIKDWANKKLTLQLDHIDGNNKNNSFNNLRLLCPNCHSQTPTYCIGKNKRQMLPCNMYHCKICKNKVSVGAVFCKKCAPTTKVNRIWPPYNDLQKMIEDKGPLSVSRELGVSRHMLYDHIKRIKNVV